MARWCSPAQPTSVPSLGPSHPSPSHRMPTSLLLSPMSTVPGPVSPRLPCMYPVQRTQVDSVRRAADPDHPSSRVRAMGATRSSTSRGIRPLRRSGPRLRSVLRPHRAAWARGEGSRSLSRTSRSQRCSRQRCVLHLPDSGMQARNMSHSHSFKIRCGARAASSSARWRAWAQGLADQEASARPRRPLWLSSTRARRRHRFQRSRHRTRLRHIEQTAPVSGVPRPQIPPEVDRPAASRPSRRPYPAR
jgi:hypothetical protein